MSEIHIGELQSNSVTELDASKLEQIIGGFYLSLNDGSKHFSLNFKSLDLKKLLGDELYDALKKGKKYSYHSSSHHSSSHKGIYHLFSSTSSYISSH